MGGVSLQNVDLKCHEADRTQLIRLCEDETSGNEVMCTKHLGECLGLG